MRCILRAGLKALRFVDRALEVLIFDVVLAQRRRTLFFGLAAALLLGLVVMKGMDRSDRSSQRRQSVLLERPWLDHLPKDEHDAYQALIFNEEGYGVSVRATAYKGQWELFVFKAKDGKLQILFPDNQRRVQIGYKVSKIEHRTFDLQLAFDNDVLGSKTYYSWKKHKSKAAKTLDSIALEHWLAPTRSLGKTLRWTEP